MMTLLLFLASLVPIFGGWWVGQQIRRALVKTWQDESDKGPPE